MRRTLLGFAMFVPLVLAGQSPTTNAGAKGFYRFPAIHDETIVFAAEGDLWSVSTSGGLARRLTTHAAEETDPVISPDGKLVAFTARYEGPAALYTMPLAGGLPTRHTFDGDAAIATTWTPDGKLVYTSTHYSGAPKPQLIQLDLRDGSRSLVPLAGASEADYDASGKTLYFVRPSFHNNVTKRYTGGRARDVWKFTDGASEAVELTGDYKGESHTPMWYAGRVYFVSDRDGTMNIWSMNENGSDKRQHTRHSGWDVRHAAMHRGKIVYQLGADLWLFDATSGRTTLVPITLQTDLDQLRENWVANPMAFLSSAHLSPNGDRVVLTSRGRVFVAPVGAGRLVRASGKDSVRYRDVVFAPNGQQLLGLSDETGEFEFTRIPANGVGGEERLTRDGSVLRFEGRLSPDGNWLAWADNNRDLLVMNVATKQVRKVSENREGIREFAWAPDSRWLAFTMIALNGFPQIKLHSIESGRNVAVTTDRTESYSPAWDTKGEFLYFLSGRNLRTVVNGPWGIRQPEPYFDKIVEIYGVSLRAGLRFPFRPDDELQGASSARPDSASRVIRVDTAGLMRRVRRVPVPSGNYSWLAVNGEALFYASSGSNGDGGTDLMALRIAATRPEPVVVLDGIQAPELSANGRKLLVRKAGALHVFDARAAKVANLNDSRVDLASWAFSINVRDDWRQIFVDAWRLERDWFYDPNMHGVDYQATLKKFLPLVDRITSRDELNDLIGWAVGELSALHTSVRGGDVRRGDDNILAASLGARLFRDPARGGYRIDYIYQTDPEYPTERSPLADPDLNIRPGDVIVAVNGVNTLDAADVDQLLRTQAGKQVLVTIRSGTTSRDLVVEPIGNEANLRYTDWEYTRRLQVEQQSGDKVGYVHLRAMGSGDIDRWYREFYPVLDRQGLIIDVRGNSGGNIESFVLEKLMRKAWMFWKSRVGEPYSNMQRAFLGHMVVLVDQETASDGEVFAEGFRRLGLGPVIGTRTWGGEIWLSDQNVLTDGGVARAPMNGVYGPEGKWLIEQEGVLPDIVVDNLPHETFKGRDAQLEAAIDYLKKKIASEPRMAPQPPKYPVRAFKYPNSNP